jgi:hypothetical protein
MTTSAEGPEVPTAAHWRTAATVQIGYVVPDVADACERFHDIYRIGPFFRIPPRPRHKVRHRGVLRETDLVTEAALAQSGDVMIELIRQHDDGPSAYRDLYGNGEQGIHHVAFWSDDYAADIESYAAAGFDTAMEMEIRDGLEVAYIDTTAVLGHMVELLPRDPSVVELFEFVRRASNGWSGGDLVIPLEAARSMKPVE